jgi:hypothetical protein
LQWENLTEGKVKGFLIPQLLLQTGNGSKEGYWSLRMGDGKKIKVILQALQRQYAGSAAAAGMDSLCPSCLSKLEPGITRCITCNQAFKDERTMVRRALLIPGGGYFYVGLRLLGVIDFWVEAWLILLFVSVVLGALQPPPGEPSAPIEVWIVIAFFGSLLVLEKLVSIYHCRHVLGKQFLPTP